MSRVGNDLWWSQIQSMQEDQGGHCKELEIQLFAKLYLKMMKDGLPQSKIREHFRETFGIKYSAFYARLRKVGMFHVL
jgi:hypothetical protein